jgi:hypothetical protein
MAFLPRTWFVIPAEAGIHFSTDPDPEKWIPAFAGMTAF